MNCMRVLTAGVWVAGLVIVSPLRAELVARDSFDPGSYAAGPLDTQNGGTGFSGGWQAWPEATVVNTSTDPDLGNPLSASLINGGSLAVGVDGQPNYNNMLWRPLDGAENGDDYYVGFLLRWANGLDSNDFILFWIDDQIADWHRTGAGHKGTGNNFFVRLSGGTDAVYGTLNQDTTYYVVARYMKETPGPANKFTRVQLYVNPTPGDFGSPDTTATAGTSHELTSFDRIGLYTGGGIEASDRIFLDEVRVGTAWADMFPAPPEGAVIACDSFDPAEYGLGPLDSQGGGIGFGAPWQADAEAEVVDTATDPDLGTPLTASLINGGSLAVGVDGAANRNNILWRILDGAESGDEYYVAFLLRWADGLDSNDFILFWIDDQTADWHRTGAGHKGSGNNFFIRLTSSPDALAGTLSQDTTYYVVVRYVKGTPGPANPFSWAELYVNPDAGDLGAYDVATANGALDPLTLFDRIGLYTGGGIEASDRIFLDEVKVATTWEAVLPSPAAGTLILVE